MRTPPGLLGAALLFWGWQTDFVILAAGMAVVLEGARVVPWRWERSRRDLNRISDLCTLIFLGTAVYLVMTRDVTQAMLGIFEWLPLTFLPLVAALAYSAAGRIELSVFFLTLRRKARRRANTSRTTIELSYPYFALCLIAASASNLRTPWFYIGVCGLVAWALWYGRSGRFSLAVWVGLLAAVSAMGYGGHLGLSRLQAALEGALEGNTDPYRSETAIGRIGTLKLSDRIVLRVEPAEAEGPPTLLREASYNMYHAGMWFAMESGFETMQPEPDGMTWALQPGSLPGKSVTISTHLTRGKGMLALPTGAFRIERLPGVELQRNPLGALKIEEGLALLTYRVRSGAAVSLLGPPQDLDTKIPGREAPVVSRIAAELGLAAQPPAEMLKTVATYFQQHFRYATYLTARQGRTTPLEDFFLRSRSGHCEYFATATVLLLRAAGLPARYATGYSVQEFSRLEHVYVVRARHAHAWALAYVDGAWHDVDTTPASWVAIEGQGFRLGEPLYDLWSWGMFLFSKWRWSDGEDGVTKHVGWLLIPLVGALMWRLSAKKRVTRSGTSRRSPRREVSYPGQDSEFYRLERRLAESGFERHPWEPLPSWLQRVSAAQASCEGVDSLPAIVALHSRYRFDPKGLSGAEREALTASVQAWFAQQPTRTKPGAGPQPMRGKG